MLLYKTFYPFITDILHTITQVQKKEIPEDELLDQPKEENTMEAAVFNIINIFIENGGKQVKEALTDLI